MNHRIGGFRAPSLRMLLTVLASPTAALAGYTAPIITHGHARVRPVLMSDELVTAAAEPAVSLLPSLPPIPPLPPLLSEPLQTVADAAAPFLQSLPPPPSLSEPPFDLAGLADLAAPLLASLPALPPLPPLPAELASVVANEPLFGTAVTPHAAALQLGVFALAGLGATIAAAEADGETPYEVRTARRRRRPSSRSGRCSW